ncbi:MAG TPA: creatininase family protein [Methanomassiliicoccaceae archaeon]|jgi:creatinine amidohydrolase|nr:creatininase family protein [Euryarchaeota archaeon]HOB39078.1 creatininase family protein [Methanomassiliicoccaceae archaeon]HOQ25374.1 creatininase family protein [Methanomassiliicoccaceae archaeon]HPT74276.1 creatininase family protein [Methanomassiliicoccaceae archaeon]HQA21750.1 creatininase family protein [Methanomassiliicoccaceae archaeon]
MRLDELSSTEFKERMEAKPVVILPVGGTEAHGSHLPLCTDSAQPEKVADEVAKRIDGLVAPPLRYAFHSSTRNMPGTLTLGLETTRMVVQDILEALVQNGADKLVVLSGHAGSSHLVALKQACAAIVRDHPGVQVMMLSDYDLARDYPVDQTGDGHGGKVETSRMMDIAPHLVKKAEGRGEYVSHGFMIVADPETSMPSGYVGPAHEASAELGRNINDFIVERLTDEIGRSFGGMQ